MVKYDVCKKLQFLELVKMSKNIYSCFTDSCILGLTEQDPNKWEVGSGTPQVGQAGLSNCPPALSQLLHFLFW